MFFSRGEFPSLTSAVAAISLGLEEAAYILFVFPLTLSPL